MKKNIENRRVRALERLEGSKFFPKVLKNGKKRTKKIGKKERRMRLKLSKTELEFHK